MASLQLLCQNVQMFTKRRLYLDNAAGVAGNPSSPHTEGRTARELLERAREKVARLLEVKADDIIFTSGATESNALAILGTVRAALKLREGQATHVLYLPSSHASIVENMALLREEGMTVEPLPMSDGRVDTERLMTMLTNDTVLVSMDAVCGETGVVWNTREVASVLEKFRTSKAVQVSVEAARPIPHAFTVLPVLHVDASQAPQTEKVTRSHFGADLLTFDISKISPERGLGVLVAHRTIPMEPLYRGGGQERGMRPGSESPVLAEAFAEALIEAVAGREEFVHEAQAQRASLRARIAADIPEAVITEGKEQAANILNISLPGRDTDYLVAVLDEAGIAVSTKSACETDSEEGSRAVYALTKDTERAKSTLRVSWGKRTHARDLERFVEVLKKSIPLA